MTSPSIPMAAAVAALLAYLWSPQALSDTAVPEPVPRCQSEQSIAVRTTNREASLVEGSTASRVSVATENQNGLAISVRNCADEPLDHVRVSLGAGWASSWNLQYGRYVLIDESDRGHQSRLVIDERDAYLIASLSAGQTVSFRVARQDIIRFSNFQSDTLPPRHVDVWLPEAYELSSARYKVLYVHDGQNLFIPEYSLINGVDWGIDDALERLIGAGTVDDTIVVGVWNTENRTAEYLPWDAWHLAEGHRERIPFMAREPRSREYAAFLAEELKPFIDERFRTVNAAEGNFLMGSSMGGLISLYTLIRYPELFAGAACLSTHWPATIPLDAVEGSEPFLKYLLEALPEAETHRLYFDYGTRGLDADYQHLQSLVDGVLRERGYGRANRWTTLRFDGAEHNEPAWRQRVEVPLTFLLRND